MLFRPITIGSALVLFLDLWAFFHIAQSDSSPAKKAIWIVLVLACPGVGFILWLLLGPRARTA